MNVTRKIVALCVGFVLCIGITGCGEKSDNEIFLDVKEKIKDAGWKIEYEKDATGRADELNLIVNNKEHFSLALDIIANNVKYITYEMQDTEKEKLGYQTEKHEDDLFVSYGVTTCSYNPIDNVVNETMTTYAFCKQEAPKKAEVLKKQRDTLLDKVDITLEELYTWSVWYHSIVAK